MFVHFYESVIVFPIASLSPNHADPFIIGNPLQAQMILNITNVNKTPLTNSTSHTVKWKEWSVSSCFKARVLVVVCSVGTDLGLW